ncbi:MAG: MarR family winged helix-turn-helix transcriptional regulator [Verrucomicrobiota bacterium]|nr:MarR family winged helix-turn-helix transcriptional regulator [Verrucomicrobiota bacterium]
MNNQNSEHDLMLILSKFKALFHELTSIKQLTNNKKGNFYFALVMTLRFLNRNGPSIIKEINQNTQLNYPTINYVIKQGKAQNMIESKVSESDGRARIISLTTLGKQQVKKLDSVHHEINQIFLRKLDANEINSLVEILEKIIANLNDSINSKKLPIPEVAD